MTNQRIVEVAQNYVGVEEISGNIGFHDKSFEQKMKAVGWQKSFAWCALFAELVAKEAFSENSDVVSDFDTLFSASAVSTWSNFSASKKYKTGKVPKPGALVIWKSPKGWTGHVGVIESVEKGNQFFSVIEGNGNPAGGREGTHVVRKRRRLDIVPRKKGSMYMLGFVYLC